MGFTIEVIPKTLRILKIFEPNIFPTEMSICFFNAAITEVANSGTEVPNAKMVSPMILSLTPKDKAMFCAEETSISAP